MGSMKTSRQRVLEYLEARGSATPNEISRALKMTTANARHHLGLLAQDGRALVVGQSSAARGRPALIYAPASRAASHNLNGLAEALLSVLNETQAGEQEALLRRVAERMLQESPAPAGSLTQRLTQAVHTLNALHYEARWEARAEAPRFIFDHCPYQEIAAGHAELCQLDALLLQRALGLPVKQSARLAQDAKGLAHCVFAIQYTPGR